MPEIIEQLNAMRHLVEDWDGYGAAAPRPEVVDLAVEFASLVNSFQRKRPLIAADIHVSPTRLGGVLIEWEDAATQHEVEISPDRAFSFLHLNKTTGSIETRKLSPADHAVVQLEFLRELSQLLAA